MFKNVLKKFLQIDDIKTITNDDLKRYFDYDHISDYLMPISYDKENEIFILEDDYIGFGFLVGTKPSVGVDTLNFIENGIYQDPSIPPNSILQWTLWGSDFLEPLLNAYVSQKDNDNEEVMKIVQTYVDFLKNKSQEAIQDDWRVLTRDAILFFTVKIPFDFKSLQSEEEYAQKVRSITHLKSSIFGTLTQASFNPMVLTVEHYVLFAKLLLNPGHPLEDSVFEYDDRYEIRDQIINRDTIIKQNEEYNTISVDGLYGKVLTVKRYPREFTVADTREWVGSIKHLNRNQINTKFLYSLIMRKATDKEIASISVKNETIMKQKGFSALSRKLQDRQEDCVLLSREMEGGQQLWKAMQIFYLYDKDKKVLADSVRTLKNMLQTQNVELQEEIVSLPFFLSTIPFNAIYQLTQNTVRRAYTMMSYNAAHLTPMQFDWKGSGTPTIPFITRSGQLAFVDLWDTNGGMNACVVGPMGQGKSVFVNHLIFNYRSLANTKIRVIDVGESYIGISKLFNGQFVKPEFNKPVKINPFSNVTLETLDRNMDFLINIVDKMVKPSDFCTDTERGLIQTAIKQCIEEKGSETDINDIRDKILKIANDNQDYEFKKLADFNLAPWCSGGQYADFMTGKNEIDLSNDLVVYELGGIKEDTKLTNIFLLSIFYFINNEIYLGSRDTKKLVIWDEAWRFTDNQAILKFIEMGAREYRKFNGSLIFITQGISDLMKNDVTKTLKNNSEYLFIFWQPPEEWERIAEDKDIYLSDYEKDIYRDTIHTVKGKYSEVLIISRSVGRGIVRLVLPREIYWMYTTDAKEVAMRNKYYQQTGDILLAVQKCIEEKG
ncbi:MAG: TraC family protein [Thermoplasmata archaeon]